MGSCKGQGEPTSNGTTVSFNDLPSTLHHPVFKHQFVQAFHKITKRPQTTPTNKHVHFSLVFCLVFLVFLVGAWWGTCVFCLRVKGHPFPPPPFAAAPNSSGRSKRPVRGPAMMAPTKAPTPPTALGLAGRGKRECTRQVRWTYCFATREKFINVPATEKHLSNHVEKALSIPRLIKT